MTHQYIIGAIHDSLTGTNAKQDMEDALKNLASQMNNYDSNNIYDVNMVDYEVTTSAYNKTEGQYVIDMTKELYNNGYAYPGDVTIVADTNEPMGYGLGGINVYPNGATQKLRGARVLHTPSQYTTNDPVKTYKSFCIHEAGHNLGATHGDGRFFQWEDSGGKIWNYDSSPMATGYAYDTYQNNDTCWEGGSTPPSVFGGPECGQKENYTGDEWTSSCTGTGNQSYDLTACTKTHIIDFIPL